MKFDMRVKNIKKKNVIQQLNFQNSHQIKRYKNNLKSLSSN